MNFMHLFGDPAEYIIKHSVLSQCQDEVRDECSSVAQMTFLLYERWMPNEIRLPHGGNFRSI